MESVARLDYTLTSLAAVSPRERGVKESAPLHCLFGCELKCVTFTLTAMVKGHLISVGAVFITSTM